MNRSILYLQCNVLHHHIGHCGIIAIMDKGQTVEYLWQLYEQLFQPQQYNHRSHRHHHPNCHHNHHHQES